MWSCGPFPNDIRHPKADVRRWSLQRRAGLFPFGLEGKAESAAADAKFGAILQDGSAHALLFQERAIRGIQIFEVHKAIADFQHAVMARDLRVGEGKVSAFAADNNAWAAKDQELAFFWASSDRQGNVDVLRQVQSLVRGREAEARGGGIRTRKGRHGGDHNGFIDALAYFHNSGFATFGAAELHLGVLREDGVIQQMLLPAMHTAGLHNSTVARSGANWFFRNKTGATRVTWRAFAGAVLNVLAFKIPFHAGERTCLSIFRGKN